MRRFEPAARELLVKAAEGAQHAGRTVVTCHDVLAAASRTADEGSEEMANDSVSTAMLTFDHELGTFLAGSHQLATLSVIDLVQFCHDVNQGFDREHERKQRK